MDHWKIRGNNYVVVLFEYYMESHNKRGIPNKYFVKTSDLKQIFDELKEKEDGYIFFDMKYVSNASSRVFSFLNNDEIIDRIVFFNVKKESDISNSLVVDLHGEVRELNKLEVIYFSDEALEKFQKANIQQRYQKQRIDILKKYVNREIAFLSSSGVYSNMSLDYKKMFECPQDLRFIIGELYYMVRCVEQCEKVDFLVAASKNAITLTAILSNWLGKPAIYHTNIGQKYVKQKFADKVESQIDAVQKEKRYLMIFDVICLGTEARILNGIINVLGGNLIGAVGMVCVQDPEAIRKFDKDSILAKAKCLSTAKEMELGYRIALTREELEGNTNGN